MKKKEKESDPDPLEFKYIIDGCYLLYKVSWATPKRMKKYLIVTLTM